MALIDALRMIAEPLRYLIDRVGRRVDGVERDIADVGNKVDFIHTTAPIVQTAQVGQTVVVKVVDENGKPTEWEAKDVSGGSAGSKERYFIDAQMSNDGILFQWRTPVEFDTIANIISGGDRPDIVCVSRVDGLGVIKVEPLGEIGFNPDESSEGLGDIYMYAGTYSLVFLRDGTLINS